MFDSGLQSHELRFRQQSSGYHPAHARKTHATRGNAAEEKRVRVRDAMMFAVKDLDGGESRVKRAEIQKALATGGRG